MTAGIFPNLYEGVRFDSLGGIVQFTVNVVKLLLSLGIVLAAVMIIVGGLYYITSAGEPDRLQQAKKVISSSVIGLVITVLAYIIVNTVTGALT